MKKIKNINYLEKIQLPSAWWSIGEDNGIPAVMFMKAITYLARTKWPEMQFFINTTINQKRNEEYVGMVIIIVFYE